MAKPYTFTEFREGPAREVAAQLLKVDIQTAASLRHIAQGLCKRIGETDRASLAKRYATLSSGEKAVALALLTLADYAHLADELADGRGFRILTQASGRHAQTVAMALE